MARTSLDLCPSSPERRQAREAVAGYHEAKLGELVAHVAEAIDRFRGGELDAFGGDQVPFQASEFAQLRRSSMRSMWTVLILSCQ